MATCTLVNLCTCVHVPSAEMHSVQINSDLRAITLGVVVMTLGTRLLGFIKLCKLLNLC